MPVKNLGPIKVENLIYFKENSVYEIFADEESPRMFIGYLFDVEEKQETVIRQDFMISNGISITDKPVDEFIDAILENLWTLK